MQNLPSSCFSYIRNYFPQDKDPLLKWFMLIFRIATSTRGVFINEMARELEIGDYKTVWVMAFSHTGFSFVQRAVNCSRVNPVNRYKMLGRFESLYISAYITPFHGRVCHLN